MTIVKCKECGKKVSDTAAACPACGAPNFIPEKKPASKIVRYGGGFVAVTILASVMAGIATNPAQSPRTGDHLTQARAIADSIKTLSRNPDSVKIDKLLISDDGKVSCTQYRAQNGFGGMNREFVVMNNGQASKSIADWTDQCRDSFKDYSSLIW